MLLWGTELANAGLVQAMQHHMHHVFCRGYNRPVVVKLYDFKDKVSSNNTRIFVEVIGALRRRLKF